MRRQQSANLKAFRFSVHSPYCAQPGYKRTFIGAVQDARNIAEAVRARGFGRVYVRDRQTGRTFTVTPDTDALALEETL